MGGLLEEGLILTVIGMGVVFLSLIILMWVIQLLHRACEPRAPAKQTGAQEDPEAGDIAPVLAAAAAWFLENETPPVYVPEVRRGGADVWTRRARGGAALSRRPR